MTARSAAIRLFQIIVRGLDYVWPKDRRMVIFGSYGGKYAGGNSKPVFDYFMQNRCGLKCYFLLRDKVDDPNYLHIKPFSFRTVLIFLRAKTVVVTHTLWDLVIFRPSRRKYQIHLWHGHSGPKADGYVSKRFTRENLIDVERQAPAITKFLATSRINLYFWAYSKILHPRQLIPLGFPRNDILLKKNNETGRLSRILGGSPEQSKVLLYAPTYRVYGDTQFFPFEDFNQDELEVWLEAQNILLLLRYHMADDAPLKETSRIRNLAFEICPEINEVLHEVDVLITDYSSISSDYLLLNRPIIYVAYDREQFEKYEGFIFGNFDFWTPGPKVRTFEELKREVELGLKGDDGYQKQRQTINKLINEYQTPESTKQVALYILKFLTEETDEYARDQI